MGGYAVTNETTEYFSKLFGNQQLITHLTLYNWEINKKRYLKHLLNNDTTQFKYLHFNKCELNDNSMKIFSEYVWDI